MHGPLLHGSCSWTVPASLCVGCSTWPASDTPCCRLRAWLCRSAPAHLFNELSPVLDNDTEMFVIKLYRMVIYETEKAAIGL